MSLRLAFSARKNKCNAKETFFSTSSQMMFHTIVFLQLCALFSYVIWFLYNHYFYKCHVCLVAVGTLCEVMLNAWPIYFFFQEGEEGEEEGD